MPNARSEPMKKKIPVFKDDRQAEEFVDRADLSEYDLSGAQLVRFEMKPKDKTETVRKHARRAGIPYQRFIRMALERAVRR